ncbi:MAG: SGNH/GDSL hydrolase family protein [Candidatus Nanopelagicales bacterium]
MNAGPGRRAAMGAAAGGTGLAALAAAGVGLLAAQARNVRRKIGPQRAVPPYQDGRYGPRTGTSLRLAVIGDSVAAGLGAELAQDTIGGIIAADLAHATNRPVSLTNHAVVGARSPGLAQQVTRALQTRPHLAIIVIGANDVITGTRPCVACAHLRDAIERLRAAGSEVIIGTCPDLGTVRPVGPPLRWVARNRSRALAHSQAIVAVATGAIPVNIADKLGPELAADPEALFAPDRFHPSALGYHRIAEHLRPAARAALGLPPVPLAIDWPRR